MEEEKQQNQLQQQQIEFNPNEYYLNNYKLLQHLGSGSYSNVYLAVDPQTQQNIAIKILKQNNQDITQIQRESVLREFEIIQSINHQNLINVIQIIEQAQYRERGNIIEKTAIITELADQGDLLQSLKFFGRWPENVSRTIFHQLINALEYLQQQNICHRDLKLENLLFDFNFNLKVADFGFARRDTGKLFTDLGSNIYKAPEIGLQQYSGASVDIFAAGIILFTFNIGRFPFTSKNNKYDALQNDPNTFWNELQNINLSDDLKMLITNMLLKDPKLRFNIQQIKESQWYKGEILNQQQLFQYLYQRNQAIQQQIQQYQQQQRQQNYQGQVPTFIGQGNYRSSENYLDTQTELYQYCEEVELDDEEYKIQCLAIDNDSDLEIQFTVELYDVGNNEIKINIFKEQGSYFQYQTLVHNIYEQLLEQQ